MTEWHNQVALVTGGARGIGAAIARRLAREGAAVCINYATRADTAEALAASIQAQGRRAIAIAADVADPAAVDSLVARTTTSLGPVTILVNNAGVSHQATLDTYDPDRFARMQQVNVEGVIHTTRSVMDGMRRQRYGRIVNVSSIAAIGTALPGSTFYAATKAAVQTLTRRFALELGGDGITVNAVAPGFVRTDMAQAGRSEEAWQDIAARIGGLAMMGRVGAPDDIANAVAFFAAPDSGWVTAQVLAVDGGRMDYIGH